MKVYVLYFSPTGGTRKAADTISAAWAGEKIEIDLADRQWNPSDLVFSKDDICIVAVPSFSGRVPQFIIPKLRKLKGTNVRAILLTAFGNRAYDDTLLELQDTLEQAGFRCQCAVAAVTQHSVMPQYGKGRPDSADLEELAEFAQICKNVMEQTEDTVAVPGHSPYREYLTIPIKPKAGRKCTGCGLCMTKCPVQAIPAANVKETDKNKCISCMQCVAICPHNARHVSKLMQTMAAVKMKKACDGRKKNEIFLPVSLAKTTNLCKKKQEHTLM